MRHFAILDILMFSIYRAFAVPVNSLLKKLANYRLWDMQ